jgi:hypothetical protein
VSKVCRFFSAKGAAPGPLGTAWGPNDTIAFAPAFGQSSFRYLRPAPVSTKQPNLAILKSREVGLWSTTTSAIPTSEKVTIFSLQANCRIGKLGRHYEKHREVDKHFVFQVPTAMDSSFASSARLRTARPTFRLLMVGGDKFVCPQPDGRELQNPGKRKIQAETLAALFPDCCRRSKMCSSVTQNQKHHERL